MPDPIVVACERCKHPVRAMSAEAAYDALLDHNAYVHDGTASMYASVMQAALGTTEVEEP